MFDVFLSYNSASREMVRAVDEALRDAGLSPWLDERELSAGDRVWKKIDEGLRSCSTCALFIGPDGMGTYQQNELWPALSLRFADAEGFRLIPVLLPGVGQDALDALPTYLSVYVFVEMRSLDDSEALAKLVRGIRKDDLVDCAFDLLPTDTEDQYRVRLMVGDEVLGEEDFAFDLDPESRTVASTLPRIECGDCEMSDLGDVGGQLWDALVTGEVKERLESFQHDAGTGRTYHIRLRLPPQLEWLPWEALFDSSRHDFLASDDRFCVVRDRIAVDSGAAEPRAARSTRSDGPLRILTIVPEGSGLDDHSELRTINNALDRLGDVTEVKTLRGQISLLQTSQVLEQEAFDIVHFIGHGDRQGDSMALRFNSNDDPTAPDWVNPETFATLFGVQSTVRLVILNCCFSSGSTSTNKEGGFGAFLLQRGVPAIISMQYEVREDVALAFSESFYKNLTSNPKPGRVDVALERTRRELRYRFNTRRQVRAFITPQLHLARGEETLLQIQQLYVPPRPERLQTVGETNTEVPGRLIDALRESRLIAILGPGVLAVDAVRDTTPVLPGPKQLAEILDQRLADPEKGGPFAKSSNDFKLCNRAGEWFHSTLLQRVCQYHESKAKKLAIIKEIRAIFSAVERPPEALLHIASWPLPGIFCTYFDGLVKQALRDGREIVEVHSLDGEVQLEAGAVLLVELRGSLQKPQSLVLTEAEEHELLWRRFERMSPQIEGLLTQELGTGLLFLGCSPRDPLVLRFAHQVSEKLAGNLGEIFFAAERCSEVDRSHWEHLGPDCEWLSGSLKMQIQQISSRLKETP